MYSSYDVNESEVNDDIDPTPFHAISASSSRLLISLCAVLTAEELLLKHEDDHLVLTIVLVENLHIH
jgi:hypothetical protein